jgi:hypothetical protein
MFETKPIEEVKSGLELVTRLAKEKIDKNRKMSEGRKNFGVNRGVKRFLRPGSYFLSKLLELSANSLQNL